MVRSRSRSRSYSYRNCYNNTKQHCGTMRMKPTFIGLGAQKCASTWIYRILQDHPEAALSKPKELDYFSYYYGRGYCWYEQFFSGVAGNMKAVGEISPSYLSHPLAPKRAHAYNPAFRIILALRDPVERAYSNHLHLVKMGYLKGSDCSFEYGLANNPMYVEQSRYATHLEAWLEYFPREAVHIVFQEEIASCGADEAVRLYRHLGLDENYRSVAVGRRFNESRTLNSEGLHWLPKVGANSARALGLTSLVQVLKGTTFIKKLKNARTQDLRMVVPPMREDTWSRLVDELTPEVKRLRLMLGRETLPWKNW